MSKHRTGLAFEKFDLHVHTPASHDFSDKNVTPEQIVGKAINEGLRGIAVTDHNSGAFVDKIKSAAKGKNLAIFPGVEITCTGGETGIHVIAIFDIDKSETHVNSLLANLNIMPEEYGKQNSITTLSTFDVISKIQSQGGLAILAHSTSAKGVLHEMKGETRTQIFTHRGLYAVEAPKSDFLDEDKKEKCKRAIDLLNGKDPNYAKRKLAVYISSDSRSGSENKHSIEGIGSNFTFFKVDEEVNLESLRQCFIDRDVRILQSFEYKRIIWPYICKISIIGGFFDEQEASFHGGLNSILGAKGAGKSLLVELLRFVLNQASNDNVILDDHNRKLQNKLETYGKVYLEFIDSTGTKCSIERILNPIEDHPYNGEGDKSLAENFTVLFMSQNEIVRIAEDPQAQIQFIDQFFDFRNYKTRIANIEKDLKGLDEQFALGLRAINELKEVSGQIKIKEQELQRIDRLLADPTYERYKANEMKDNVLKSQSSILVEIQNKLDTKINEVTSITLPEIEESLKNDPAIKRNNDALLEAKNKITVCINMALDEVRNTIVKLQNEYDKWGSTFNQERNKYEEYVRNAGTDKKGLEAKRTKFNKEKEQLVKSSAKFKEKIEALKNIRENRDKLIEEIFNIYKEYTKQRKEKCAKFEAESAGRLKVSINESTNIDEFKQQLIEMKRGSYLRDSDIEQICDSISPNEFIIELLRYYAKKDERFIKNIVKKVSLDEIKITQLCKHLLEEVEFEDLLKLQYKAHPQDRPEIRFKINDDKYELIKNISVGQKCTAMLIMALSDGNFPIVIDQPEDSLDVRSIWEDMCSKIRKGKESRQFIFTTHSSCLAVASDTDMFTIVESDASKGKIVMSGALDNPDVKEEVIKYLEGGRTTYSSKAEKYGLLSGGNIDL